MVQIMTWIHLFSQNPFDDRKATIMKMCPIWPLKCDSKFWNKANFLSSTLKGWQSKVVLFLSFQTNLPKANESVHPHILQRKPGLLLRSYEHHTWKRGLVIKVLVFMPSFTVRICCPHKPQLKVPRKFVTFQLLRRTWLP